MVVADLDDVHEPAPTANTRPRRTNAGAGVERLQMSFSGQGYGAKREFNLVTNGTTESEKQTNQHNTH